MTTPAHAPAYDGRTTSAQVDPEAHRSGGPPGSPALAVMARSPHCWPCADVDADWVPAHEDALVPPDVAATCASCPLRGACLAGAVQRDELGYWAGTTTADRRAMRAGGTICLERADACQARAAAKVAAGEVEPSHAPGAAGYRSYRAGCRCPRCRAGNAAARAAERARGPRCAR